MKDSSPISKKSPRKKGIDSPESIIHKNKKKKSMSLLTMWKIEGSQKSVVDAASDSMSPSKSAILSPKPVATGPTEAESDTSSVDQQNLGYCPNCQMPFTALIKQSPNWHVTECMDFGFQHSKECPSGDTCSSTISSHYMKFSHYGLAKIRSGVSRSLKKSPSSKKSDSPISAEKVSQKKFSPSSQCKSSSPKPATTSVSQSTSPQTPTSKDKEKCSPNCSIIPSSSFVSSEVQQHSDQTKSAVYLCSSQDLSAVSSTKPTVPVGSDCKNPFQEFKTPASVSLTRSKIHSRKNISSPRTTKNCNIMQKYNNENNSNCNKRVLSKEYKAAGDNVIDSESGISDREMEDLECHVVSSESSNLGKEIAGSRVSGAHNVSEMEISDKDLDDKTSFRSPAVKKRKLTAGNNSTNSGDSQKYVTDICALADEFFPGDDMVVNDVAERINNFSVNDDDEEELFVFTSPSDANKRKMVQTVITKSSSSDCDSSFNMALSQVKLEQPSPKKKIRSILQSKSPNCTGKTALNTSQKKLQTSLMSFFKPPGSKEGSSPKIQVVESVNSSKLKQTKWDKNLEKNKSFGVEQQGWNNGVRPVKKCPFYKKIPDTTFCVDAFSYGSIPGIQHYFLSHFHYDHYMGLTRGFRHPVYCSVVTANLVSLKIRLPSKFIHILKLNEAVVIDSVEVTALDANHCPGSVMFLFGFPDGRYILHTGDFRATPAMELYPSLINYTIERLYLDTTYCNPRYDFPSQDSILELITSLVVPRMKSNGKVLVACGSYTIGKERAFMAIAECVDCKIWAHKTKLNVLRCLEDIKISSRLVTDENLAKIHVLPMNMIKISTLQEYLLKFPRTFDEIIGLKPTGWEHNSSGSSNIFSLKPISRGPVTIYGVPYSEHSSFSELKKFVQFLRPRNIIPTVNVGSASSRNQMASHFQQWCT